MEEKPDEDGRDGCNFRPPADLYFLLVKQLETLTHAKDRSMWRTHANGWRFFAVVDCVYDIRSEEVRSNHLTSLRCNRRRALRKVKACPSSDNIENYRIIRAKARRTIKSTRRQSWQSYVSKNKQSHLYQESLVYG